MKNKLSTIQTAVETNVLGTMYATHAVLSHMKKAGTGRIVNIGSQAGLKVKKNRSVYAVTKWAITGFSRVSNEELDSQNIRVTALYPGTTDTGFFAQAENDKDLSKHSIQTTSPRPSNDF